MILDNGTTYSVRSAICIRWKTLGINTIVKKQHRNKEKKAGAHCTQPNQTHWHTAKQVSDLRIAREELHCAHIIKEWCSEEQTWIIKGKTEGGWKRRWICRIPLRLQASPTESLPSTREYWRVDKFVPGWRVCAEFETVTRFGVWLG